MDPLDAADNLAEDMFSRLLEMGSALGPEWTEFVGDVISTVAEPDISRRRFFGRTRRAAKIARLIAKAKRMAAEDE